METEPKEETIELLEGLYLIKYVSAEDEQHPPKILLSRDPTSEVELILPPRVDDAVLWSPGACLVARARRNGRLLPVIQPGKPGSSNAVSIEVITLTTDPDGLGRRQPDILDLSNFRILAHVARVGDVRVEPGNWIAGPAAPARIEGISIEWSPRPAEIDFRYAARTGEVPIDLVEPGVFVGTRGRALPLLGVVFEISGRRAQGFQLTVDAMFPTGIESVTGDHVAVTGPTGVEPLIGLRLTLAPENSRDKRPDIPAAQTSNLEAPNALQPHVESTTSGNSSSPSGKPDKTGPVQRARIFRSKRNLLGSAEEARNSQRTDDRGTSTVLSVEASGRTQEQLEAFRKHRGAEMKVDEDHRNSEAADLTRRGEPSKQKTANDQIGYVEFFGRSLQLRAWIFGGWLSSKYRIEDIKLVRAQFKRGAVSGRFSFATFQQPDAEGIGQGILLFLQEDVQQDLGESRELAFIEIGFSDEAVRIVPTGKVQNMVDGEVDDQVRSLVAKGVKWTQVLVPNA